MSSGSHKARGIREKINDFTAAVIMFISAAIFLSLVPFLPAAPLLPALIGAGIAALSYKNLKWAARIFGGLVFCAILWQMGGFGVLAPSDTNIIRTLTLCVMVLVPLFMTAIDKPIAVSLAALAAALMLTPYFFLSIPMVVVATFLSGIVGIGTLAICFVLYLLPFLLLENALYLTLPSATTLPITFAQLSNVLAELRPPLPGLNFFVTGFPSDYISTRSADVVKVLSGNAVLVVIEPLMLLGVVFVASASIAAFSETLIKKLRAFGGLERPVNLFAEFTISVVMPLVFFLLLTALSPAYIGGYQTSFNGANGSMVLLAMVGSSIGIATIFAAREFLIRSLERVEFAKERLVSLLGELSGILSDDQAVVTAVTSNAPSLDLGSEMNIINSCSSMMADIKNHMPTADYPTLLKWIDSSNQVKTNLKNLPEVVRVKLANELSTLSSLISTFNATLQEVGAKPLFQDVRGSIREMNIKDSLSEHQRVILDIGKTIPILFDKYTAATKAYAEVSNLEPLTPPVSPVSLLDSHDFFMVMKLTCDEYWLNFHMKRKDELEARICDLLSLLAKLQDRIGIPMGQRLAQFAEFLRKAKPVDSPEILKNLGSIKSALIETIESAKQENDKLNSATRKMMPIASRIVDFESMDQANRLQNLCDEVESENASLEGVTKSIELILPALQSHEESRKRDLNRLLIVSQYPFVKRWIRSMLGERRKLEVAKMPFKRDASAMYLRIYAASTPSFTYDDESEEIRPA